MKWQACATLSANFLLLWIKYHNLRQFAFKILHNLGSNMIHEGSLEGLQTGNVTNCILYYVTLFKKKAAKSDYILSKMTEDGQYLEKLWYNTPK